MRPLLLILVLALLLVMTAAPASTGGDPWLCREEGSLWSGNLIVSCGVGEAATESDARHQALINAYRELMTVCDHSVECRSHELDAVPLRTQCLAAPDRHHLCYRGVRARILPLRSAAWEQQPRRVDPERRDELTRQLKILGDLHSITEAVAASMASSF